MTSMELAPIQIAVSEAKSSSLLLGPAGSGKSLALQQRLVQLLASGEPAYTVLVLVAEPEHSQAFLDRVQLSALGPYAELFDSVVPGTEMTLKVKLNYWQDGVVEYREFPQNAALDLTRE